MAVVSCSSTTILHLSAYKNRPLFLAHTHLPGDWSLAHLGWNGQGLVYSQTSARAPFVLRPSALLEASSAHKEDSAQETKPNHSSRSILFRVTVSSVWPQETESRLKNPKVWTQYTTTQRHRQEPGLVWRQKAGEN